MTGLLNPTEAAKALGVSKTTLWRLVKSGRLPAVRITSKILRFECEAIAAYVAQQRDPGSEAA